MRIVIAPDSFKGSLTAQKAAEAMARGVRKVLPRANLSLLPLSDGGEGLVQALVAARGGRIVERVVQDPLGKPVRAKLGVLAHDQTVVIEMAQASGLTLIPPEKRNPLHTSTFGTGQLILAALELNCTKLIIGIGGSGTNDGGAGMAQALGARFLAANGEPLKPGGGELARLAKIDVSGLDPRLQKIEINIASDVDNPLVGPRGASYIYGPQKGATPQQAEHLDGALTNYAKVLKRDLAKEVKDVAGAGAAGGLGAGLLAFTQGKLVPGIELVLKAVNFAKEAEDAMLVLTGEGKLDAQSVFGKVPAGVARESKKLGVPVVVIAGTVLPEAESLHAEGVTAYFSLLNEPLSLEAAMERSEILLENQTAEVIRLFASGKAIR